MVNTRQKEFIIVNWIRSCNTADQLLNLYERGYSNIGELAFQVFWEMKNKIAPSLKLRIKVLPPIPMPRLRRQ